MKKILADEDELNARIYRFPTSAIKYYGKKINYYDFISSMQDENCTNALLRMLPAINLDEIRDFINNEKYLSETQKRFYNYYISQRYDKILKIVYEKYNKKA